MTDSFDSSEPPPVSKSESKILLTVVGIVLMVCACSLLPSILVRNGRLQLFESIPAATAEPFVYTGQHIVTVPAGSRSISALSHSSQAPVVVMFDADWCSHCENMRPRLEREIEEQAGDMLLVIVNIDDCPRLKSKYRAGSVPMVVAFVDGLEVDRFVGEYDQPYVHQFLDDLPLPN
jgi:thiol-disulfide isomerase/thioredoxin